MGGVTPSGRTKKWLAKDGWPLVADVERFNSWSKTRHDMFGFIDIAAFDPARGWLLVQVTSGLDNAAKRRRKILGDHRQSLIQLLSDKGELCNEVEVHGWRKIKGGQKRATWQVKRWRAVLGEDGPEFEEVG